MYGLSLIAKRVKSFFNTADPWDSLESTASISSCHVSKSKKRNVTVYYVPPTEVGGTADSVGVAAASA